MANSVDPDQTAPIGAVCSGSTLFAYILNLSVMLGNYLQQTTSADDIFRCIFFLGTLRVNIQSIWLFLHSFSRHELKLLSMCCIFNVCQYRIKDGPHQHVRITPTTQFSKLSKC